MSNKTKGIFKFFNPVDRSALLITPDSFSAFFERTHLPVFRYLYGLTGGPQEDVEDLTAETFLRAWRARRAFHEDSYGALGWLMKIARHLVIDDYRRRKARPVMEDPVTDDLSLDEPMPEEAVLAGERQQVLWNLLRTLPDEPKEILILRYWLDWRVNQIAVYLETPENNVSAIIRRTLERLRQQWPA